MSFETYKAPLIIHPRFSLQLAMFIIGLHLAVALSTIFSFPASLLHKLLFVVIITFSAIYYYRLHIAKQSTNSIQRAFLSVENQWQVQMAKDQQRYNVTLLPSSMLNPYLIILNFKTEGRKYRTLILPIDSIDKVLARRLRARIRVLRL